MNLSDIRVPPTIIPVVMPPSAESTVPLVKNLMVFGAIAPPWLEPVEGSDERGRPIVDYALRGQYIRNGFKLLRDVYKEEGNEQGWSEYKAYLADWAARRTVSSFPKHKLPASLQKGHAASKVVDRWATDAPAVTPATTQGFNPGPFTNVEAELRAKLEEAEADLAAAWAAADAMRHTAPEAGGK